MNLAATEPQHVQGYRSADRHCAVPERRSGGKARRRTTSRIRLLGGWVLRHRWSCLPVPLIQHARDRVIDFFSLPETQKAKSAPPPATSPRGYSPMGNRSLSYVKRRRGAAGLAGELRDRAAGIPLGLIDANPAVTGFVAPNIWPDQPADYQPALSAYYRAMERLAETIMEIFAVALGSTSISSPIRSTSMSVYCGS